MFAKAAATLVLLLPFTPVLAGQVPIVNGVPGGIREGTIPGTRKVLNKLADQPHALATTPGKLRIVENSGVCGAPVRLHSCVTSLNDYTETTQGVYQASGYGDLTSSKSLL
jgi:hypothetical protein